MARSRAEWRTSVSKACGHAAAMPNYAFKGTLRTLREFPGYDVGAGPLNAALGNYCGSSLGTDYRVRAVG